MDNSLKRHRGVMAPLCLAASLAWLATPAAAAGFTDFFNNILAEFISVKQPVALIAIMLVGFGWVFNFVDLRRAGWLVGGIVLIYAASDVLAMITG